MFFTLEMLSLRAWFRIILHQTLRQGIEASRNCIAKPWWPTTSYHDGEICTGKHPFFPSDNVKILYTSPCRKHPWMSFKSHLFTCIHRVQFGRGSLCLIFSLLIVDPSSALTDETNAMVWKGSNSGKPVPGQQATLCPHVVWGHVVPSMASESIFSTCACGSLCAQTHTPKPNIYIFILPFSSPQDANKGDSVCLFPVCN